MPAEDFHEPRWPATLVIPEPRPPEAVVPDVVSGLPVPRSRDLPLPAFAPPSAEPIAAG
jgi:hypothetical protein